MKNLRKMTMLLFVAATMFSFSSCNKDDDDNGISETNLVGEWGWPSDHALKFSKLVIKNDHTATFNSLPYTWTLKGNTFSGTAGNGHEINFKIKSLRGEKMVIEGEERLVSDVSSITLSDLSGTLIKTVTTTSPTLTEDIMVGTWKFKETGQYNQYDVIIKSDHTFEYQVSHDKGTWEIEGSKFIGIEKGGNYDGSDREYSFTVESMTSSSTEVVLKAVDGKDGNKTFVGTYSKNL